MDVFEKCHIVNDYINTKNDSEARNELIKILNYCKNGNIAYPLILNNLIRQLGLYPYIQNDTANWDDRFIYEAFKVDVGGSYLTLHREQSAILKRLVSGESLAVSAPTSFGKSFIIDSFIALNNPDNVMIIVPTIALTDETRRRINRKFSNKYKIITTADVELDKKNIFIFPQERAVHYVEQIKSLDILIIDEFYKASKYFDKERSSALLNTMLKFGKIARQKYFLAPNISSLKQSLFTKDMEFIVIDFNTVFLKKHIMYKEIGDDENKKELALVSILKKVTGKTLIYAGTFKNINRLSDLFLDNFQQENNPLLDEFSEWLSKNYSKSWKLASLIQRGFGIHNGNLHRSLSQLQIKLFEEINGIKTIFSTSSIIEGINTSAENIVLWSNLRGGPGKARINDFTYKNIIGRGGRMFKYFIGNIYILAAPPEFTETQLTLDFPDELVGNIDENEYKNELTSEQVDKIKTYKGDLINLLGESNYENLKKENILRLNDAYLLKEIIIQIKENKSTWRGLSYLNSDDVNSWDNMLYKIIHLQAGAWGIEYTRFVGFIKNISTNWTKSFPSLLNKLKIFNISIDDFFKLERTVAFNFSALVHDVNVLQKYILDDSNVDISPFVTKLSYAFLPPVVYQLEEYGLPRMLSRKLHDAKYFDFENTDIKLHDVIRFFNEKSAEEVKNAVTNFDSFDKYIFDYFYEGILIKSDNIMDDINSKSKPGELNQ
jgi:hypothetical protein